MQEFWILVLAAVATLLGEFIYDVAQLRYNQRQTC